MSVDAKASPRQLLENARARVREFFVMEGPRARAARLPAPKAEQLRAWHAAARLRIRHADDLQGPYASPAAFVLYRDALRLLACASLLDETPDAEVTTEVDASAHLDDKIAAMRAHATQIAVDGPFFALSNNVGQEVWAVEYYVLARSAADVTQRRETDFFDSAE